ncbi:MAG: nucleotidyltransferase [Cyclobacteriaceae bacterium]|nr:nucleotidyltransferase [Cyclobacteriaceae bacterium]
MNFTHPAHQEMLFALIDGQVDFILIGGYAVIYHGYVRTTGDMDVWVKPTNENKEKLLNVFRKLRFDPEGVEIIAKMDFSGVVVFHVGVEPERIDFLSKVQGLNFDEAYNNKASLKVKNFQIPVLRLDDLITNKLLSGRTKDKADVEYLIKINQR